MSDREVLVCSCCGREVLCMECDVTDENRELLERERKFVQWWNTFIGAARCRYPLSQKRRGSFRQRLSTKGWQEDAVKAKEKFPLSCFDSKESGWMPNIEWFLRPDTVTSILEGKYDWSKGDTKPPDDDGFSQREKAREAERKKFRGY